MTPSPLFRFGNFQLDPSNACLWHRSKKLPLMPKDFVLLHYLVAHAGQLVSKNDLFHAGWGETRVSAGVLKNSIERIRRVLGDSAKTPRFIETVQRRGYRFLPAVTTPSVVSNQFSVFSSNKADPSSPQLTTDNCQLTTPLVGRETELICLHTLLAKAENGERQMVFVTGEPGIGKTALLEAFLWSLESRVQSLASQEENQKAKVEDQSLAPNTQHPTPVLVSQGQCIEQYGAGEPYLPVLEALGRLCRSPEGEQIKAVLRQYAPTWLIQMSALLSTAELQELQLRVTGATRERMLREFAEALEVLTVERMLVLVLEDLHWVDMSTVELLAVLAHRRESARLLVLGTYRPADVLGTSHPLKGLTHELSAHHLSVEVTVRVLRKEAVESYLQQRFPHSVFPVRLAEVLHRRSDGTPLFLVSIVDELVAQGVIIQVDGTWMLQNEGEHLTTAVPESIRHLVARQRERLMAEEQQILEAASIAGMEFSVAAVAAALDTEVIAVGVRCAQLAERQQFLRPAGIAEWPDGTVAARYGFLHALYQQLWHERVIIEQQQVWHLRMGERKEIAYGSRTGEIATELAVHFEQGRAYPRAVRYLQQAGENAIRRSASTEAIGYFTRGLDLLKTLPETPERARQELMVHVNLGPVLMMTNGRSAPVVEDAYTRALQLCHQTGEQAQLFSALRGLWECYETRGEFQKSHQLAEQFFTVAKLSQDPAHELIAHDALGDTLFWRGEFVSAREHLAQGVALYNPHQHAALAFFHGGYDPGVACACLEACVLWILGYPDQALARMDTALTLARQLGHLHSQASALIWAAVLHQLRREAPLTQARAGATIPLCREQGFPYYLAAGTIMHGWALARQGQGSEGVAQICQGVEVCQALGVEMARTYFLALLAEAYGTAGQPEQGLNAINEALELVNTNGEQLCEAELYRLKGTLTLQSQASLERVRTGQNKSANTK
jgi:DNA-binding winged helix-turn-helix (wHTH) protein/predicted ATPase